MMRFSVTVQPGFKIRDEMNITNIQICYIYTNKSECIRYTLIEKSSIL